MFIVSTYTLNYAYEHTFGDGYTHICVSVKNYEFYIDSTTIRYFYAIAYLWALTHIYSHTFARIHKNRIHYIDICIDMKPYSYMSTIELRIIFYFFVLLLFLSRTHTYTSICICTMLKCTTIVFQWMKPSESEGDSA